MSKGGGSSQTIQKADPWAGVQPYLTSLYDRANEGGQNQLPFFPNQTYANLDPLQTQGQQGILDWSQQVLPQGINQYQGALQGYMNAPLNITNDPAVQAMIASNEQSATDWLTRQALPSVRSGAVAAGQLGGSRQGLAEGMALGDAAKALSSANAQTMLGAYDTSAKLGGVAAGLFPSALQMGSMPHQTMMDIGGQRQGVEQQAINEAMQRYYYPEQSLWDTLGKQASIYSGAQPFGSSTSSQSGSGDPLSGAIGGGLLGYGAMHGLAGMTGGAVPGLAGMGTMGAMLPWVGIPALLGGLLS